MNEFVIYTIFIVVWFTLQIWVFPKLGIPTCMSGSCRIPQRPYREDEPEGQEKLQDGQPEAEG